MAITVNISPNMLLPVPVPTVDPGPDWAQNLYACLYSQVDSHDHSSGKGVQVTPAGLNINADLTFQGNSATNLLRTQYQSQTVALDGGLFPTSVYVAGGDLWYNSLSGDQVQITSGSSVNVTSSGISSGTATASFVSSVLVVNAAANTPANIQGGSIFLGNNVVNSKFLELSPPNAMATNYQLILPALPSSTSFVTLDTSGNLSTAANVSGSQIASGSITGSQLANGTITTTQISNSAGITGTQLANGTLTGTQLATDINLPHSGGTGVTEGGRQLTLQNTATATPMAILRGAVSSTGAPLRGEGFTVVHTGTGVYTITFTTPFNGFPVAVATNNTAPPASVAMSTSSVTVSGMIVGSNAGGPVDAPFSFIVIGT